MQGYLILEFCEYHKVAKDYRNKSLSHREYQSGQLRIEEPSLEIARKTFVSIYLIAVRLAKKYTSVQNFDNSALLRYPNVNSVQEIEDFIEKTYPIFNFKQ